MMSYCIICMKIIKCEDRGRRKDRGCVLSYCDESVDAPMEWAEILMEGKVRI